MLSGLGVDLDWLDNRIDFSLLDGLELLKEEPPIEDPIPPPVKNHEGQLSDFQAAAFDLLESLMVENNSEPEVSYTTLTPQYIAPSSQPLGIEQGDQVLPDCPVSLDSSMISPAGSIILSEDLVISPQWDGSCPMTPEEVESLLSSPPISPSDSFHSSDSEWLPSEEPKKARAKPYARPSENEVATATPKVKGFDPKTKKERKKVQNKNAATRYRQKKKTEADVTASDFEVLTDRNTELKRKVDEMEHEIQYMKGILKDIYKVKGLITD